MPYQIFLHPKAATSLKKQDNKIQSIITNRIQELKKSPKLGQHLLSTNFWKLRAGDYRIIYEIDPTNERIIILYIGHRKHVYDKFQRML